MRVESGTVENISEEKLTILNLIFSRKSSFIIEPSTTVPATMPSSIRRASVDVHQEKRELEIVSNNPIFLSISFNFLDFPISIYFHFSSTLFRNPQEISGNWWL